MREIRVIAAVLGLLLAPALHAQEVRGRILDEVTGLPVSQARVLLVGADGAVQAATVTGSDGRFALSAPVAGAYRLHIAATGYDPALFELQVAFEGVMEIPGGALSLSPVARRQDAALVQTGFYERRSSRTGQALTRDEFLAWSPTEVADILRRLRQFRVSSNTRYGRSGDTRTHVVEARRALPGITRGSCPPLFYVDGVFLGDALAVDVNQLVPVGQLAALEAYDGTEVPSQYNRTGSACGVILFWTQRGNT